MITQNDIDSLRNTKIESQNLFIGSKKIPAQSGETIDVMSPIDGKILTTIANADANDVNNAVTIARKSFENGSCIF